jgi:hypothetical protein
MHTEAAAAENPIGQTRWRRGGDSNPRDPFGPNGFQDRRIQPLSHPSVFDFSVLCDFETGTLKCDAAADCHRARKEGASGNFVQWVAESQSPTVMYPSGYRRDPFQPGDQVTVRVEQVKNGGPVGRIIDAVTADGTKLERAWLGSESFRPPSRNRKRMCLAWVRLVGVHRLDLLHNT